mmetsp:Transcript_57628/g.182535  ORF Transcript_57628/g.182535 Transcript_57628/m.182535 type:complete len:511 (+) Transcript_57628:124-1656(+)
MSWSLSDEQRADMARRIMENITGMAFFNGQVISEAGARAAAKNIESRGYYVAGIAASTTTGSRPHIEGVRGYARACGGLVLEAVRGAGATDSAAAGASSTTEFDLFGNNREFLQGERAEEVLAPLLKEGAAFTKIRLSTKSFGREAAEVTTRALHNIRGTLKDADFSDIIAGRPEDEALDTLRIIAKALSVCKLRSFDFSDNALGEKGVRAVGEAMTSQPQIEEVAFRNDGISVHAARALDELMPSVQALRKFHFFNNMSGDEGAEALANILSRAPNMEDFRMVSTRVAVDGGIALAKGLAATRKLRRLDLSDNMLGESGEAIGQMLAAQGELLYLNLGDTGLMDEGVAAVLNGVAASGAKLEVLEMGSNEITAEGAQGVAMFLAQQPKLTKLNLRENELGDRGVLMILKGLAHSKAPIQHLDLSENQLRRVGALAVASYAAGLGSIDHVGLNGNALSEDGVEEVAAALAGKEGVLSEMDDNDEDNAEEDEDEGDEGGDELDEALAGLAL